MKPFFMKFTFLIALAIGLGATQASCPGVNPGPVIANAVIDCTAQNQDQITALVGEFKPLIQGDSPDWSAVYQRAKSAGKAIGGCALAEIVQDYLGNRGSPPTAHNSQLASQTLERFRADVADGATFHMGEDRNY